MLPAGKVCQKLQTSLALTSLLLLVMLCPARAAEQQTTASVPKQPVAPPVTTELQNLEKKYPGLIGEFGTLQRRLQNEVPLPGPRLQSRLLPLLPASTVFYAAIPNYGDSVHQALQIFDQELKESNVLREWWEQTGFARSWPKFKEGLDKTYAVSQYLGDEVVFSISMGQPEPAILALAEARKPGLKSFLPALLKESDSKPTDLRVLDPKELAASRSLGDTPVLLVRPDLVVFGSDPGVARTFNTQLEQNSGARLPATPFGERLLQSYHEGTVVLLGADLQRIISQIPRKNPANEALFQSSGFSDAKYAIWEHKQVAGKSVGDAELTFIGPRRGIASWLGASAPTAGLGFVSPKAAMAMDLQLKNPAEIFDDLQEILRIANPAGLSAITQVEQGMGINLKQDLLSKLTGEITFTTSMPATGEEPLWSAMLRVNDVAGLQRTLQQLISRAGMDVRPTDEGGLVSYAVPVGSRGKPQYVNYAFAEGYLLAAPSRDLLTQALVIHRSGDSLLHSREFLSSLPAGHSAIASAIIYQNFGPYMANAVKALSPEMAQLFSQLGSVSAPVSVSLYGEENAIKEGGTSSRMDMAGVLIGAAIAIPNLLRARMAANDAGAASVLRTVNTAQVTYVTMYPDHGYAPDLATLGPGNSACTAGQESAKHACLVDSTIGGSECTSGKWCTKSGFRFSLSAVCKTQPCNDYVAVATPISPNTGSRSFCSVSDAVIRVKQGIPLEIPITASECRSWLPLH